MIVQLNTYNASIFKQFQLTYRRSKSFETRMLGLLLPDLWRVLMLICTSSEIQHWALSGFTDLFHVVIRSQHYGYKCRL